MFRGGFAWLNAVQNMSGERQWKRKDISLVVFVDKTNSNIAVRVFRHFVLRQFVKDACLLVWVIDEEHIRANDVMSNKALTTQWKVQILKNFFSSQGQQSWRYAFRSVI